MRQPLKNNISRLPMDIPSEKAYFFLRKKYRGEEIGSSPVDARPGGPLFVRLCGGIAGIIHRP